MSAAARTLEEAAPIPRSCRHCGSLSSDDFCCIGCREVHALLHDSGLDRFYELGGGEGYPVVRGPNDHKWLEPLGERLARATGSDRLFLDVQGVHCAACVWVLEKLFRRRPGAGDIVVNSAIGTIELTATNAFPLAAWVADVEAIGYRLGPPLKKPASKSDLVWRMGVCVAIAMNTMIFGFAIYCGLPRGAIWQLFHGLDFGLSLVSVLVGGSVFFRSAWASLRRGILHLDLPIALGVVLVFVSSTYTYALRGGATSYFDTLNVFIALMLVGRFLQERVVARNRALVLADDGADGLLSRRVAPDGTVALVRCTELAAGDVILAGTGDIVPVESALLGTTPALFSLDWINGESAPRLFQPGARVPAGAFARSVVRIACTTDFDRSTLIALLRHSTRRDDEQARTTAWYAALTRRYVAAVLVLATGAFVGWLVATHDLARALDVVAGVLIVTCPCAFGIATPLAYELAHASLRRAGLFVRTSAFLDRAAEVDTVVFDKTGTLTTGAVVVADPAAIRALPDAVRAQLHAMAIRSSHPKSRAIAAVLADEPLDPRAEVREIVGKGMEALGGDSIYRLGARRWALLADDASAGDVYFTRNGVKILAITTEEQLRNDAAHEVHALQAEGYATHLLTGDTWTAARTLAATCGIPQANVEAARSPEGKAAWLRDEAMSRALFVGDGINDSLVAEAAWCAGTPAIDRPFMASKCDFYFVTPGLRPLRHALDCARTLARVVRQNLVIALVYNGVTVTLALGGWMTPLLCAVLMPLSSLSTVVFVTTRLSRRRKN